MHYLIIWFLKPAINLAARKKLAPVYGKASIKRLLKIVWEKSTKHYREIPKEETLGSRIMVGLAVLSGIFYEELLLLAGNEKKAISQFNEIAWIIYRKMGRFAYLVTGLRTRDTSSRLQKATSLFRTFPFGSPSYQWKDLPSDPGIVAFNCERCPVANYFKAEQMAHIGYQTWCQLDFRLAELFREEHLN
ncbi:MAG: hypothetical protein R3B93_06210 [Bacteroidia bacterium]